GGVPRGGGAGGGARPTGGDRGVQAPPDGSRIDPPAPDAEEDRHGLPRAALLSRYDGGPTAVQPILHRAECRDADGNDPLFTALAHDPDRPPRAVEVTDVQPAQFADPDTGGVQQLHDRCVPLPDCRLEHVVGAGTGNAVSLEHSP